MSDDINSFILLQQKAIRQFDVDVQNIFTNMNNHLKSVLTTVENKNNTNTNTACNQATIDHLQTQIQSAQVRLFWEFDASLNDKYEWKS